MNRLRLLGSFFALLLGACGAPSPPETAPTLAATPPPAPTQEIIDSMTADDDQELALGESGEGLFSITLTGTLEQTLAGPGGYTCVDDVNVLASAPDGDRVVFRVPAGTPAGEYAIGTGENNLTAELVYGGAAYTDDVFGILTLAAVPDAAGDAVSGSFDMTFTGAAGSVNGVGQFDLFAEAACGA
jgi:hypothetical protein